MKKRDFVSHREVSLGEEKIKNSLKTSRSYMSQRFMLLSVAKVILPTNLYYT